MFKYLKNKWLIGTLIALILIIIAVIALHKPTVDGNITLYTVKSQTVSQIVSVTGKVKSAEAVDLSFEKTGTVTKVNDDVGDRVKAGDIIVETDDSDLQAQLEQAQAEVSVQKAKLAELKAGTREEELAITESKLQSATTSVAEAQSALLADLHSAYITAEDAIYNKVDQFFINPRTNDPQVVFSQSVESNANNSNNTAGNSALDATTNIIAIQSGRVEVEQSLADLSNLIAAATTSNVTTTSAGVKQDMAEIKLFLDTTAIAVDALTPTNTITQTTVSEWKDDLTAARNNVNAALTDTLNGDSALQSAEDTATQAQQQLTLEQAGTVQEEIDAEQGQVVEAQATVDGIYSQIAKTRIKSPIDGIVTVQNAKVGELAPLATPVVSIISDSQFEIEADVAESDIAKISVGDSATVTLDAYGPDVVFDAVVVSIDPAETIVDDVPTYKTTFQFKAADDRIKSGMTANIDIQGVSHPNVLAVPERAIVTRNDQKYVTVKTGKITQDVLVTTDLRGSDGSIEVSSGLNAGDVVVITTGTD